MTANSRKSKIFSALEKYRILDTSRNMERAGLYCTIIASAFLMIWAVFSIITGISSSNIIDMTVGIIFLIIGGVTGYYAVRYYRKVIYIEELLDSAFEEGIYKRLEPLVNVVSESQAEMEYFSNDLKLILYKIEKLETELEKVKKINPSILPHRLSDNFIIQSIFLLVITLSIFIFVVEYPIFITPYLMPIVFFMWWFSITSEFDLFKNEDAWILGAAPIIVIPVLAIFIGAILDFRLMIGILFLIAGFYVGGYYIWASYTVNGTLPFNIHHDLKKAMLELSKKNRD